MEHIVENNNIICPYCYNKTEIIKFQSGEVNFGPSTEGEYKLEWRYKISCKKCKTSTPSFSDIKDLIATWKRNTENNLNKRY